MPALVVVTCSLVPLLPGLSVYRGLASIGQNAATGLVSLFTAATIAVALSSGAILGEYIAQPLKREARRLENRMAGPRLVGPIAARRSRTMADPSTRFYRSRRLRWRRR